MGKSSTQRKEFLPIIDELRRQGWKVDQTSGSHWRARPPDQTKTGVYFAISGEPRAIKNTLSDLRKRGFVWPPKDATDEQLSVEAGLDEDEKALEERAQEHYEAHANGVPTGIPGIMVQGPLIMPPPESSEQRMERLFAELRDAKTYLTLADSELADRERDLVEATKQRDEAQQERARAADKLRSLKAAFDEAFTMEKVT